VDSRMQGLIMQLMTNNPHPMSLLTPAHPGPPLSRPMNARNEYSGQPNRGRGFFHRRFDSSRNDSSRSSQHHRGAYQRSHHGPSRSSSSPRLQSSSVHVAPHRESPRESPRRESPRRESSRHESPRRDHSRRRNESNPKPMDVDDPENNSIEEGVSRGNGSEDHNETRIEIRRAGSNAPHSEPDPQDWEALYATDEIWKEQHER